MQSTLWTLAMSLSSTSGFAGEATVPTLPETVNTWPWLALGCIALLLGVIEMVARRRLPFGPR